MFRGANADLNMTLAMALIFLPVGLSRALREVGPIGSARIVRTQGERTPPFCEGHYHYTSGGCVISLGSEHSLQNPIGPTSREPRQSNRQRRSAPLQGHVQVGIGTLNNGRHSGVPVCELNIPSDGSLFRGSPAQILQQDEDEDCGKGTKCSLDRWAPMTPSGVWTDSPRAIPRVCMPSGIVSFDAWPIWAKIIRPAATIQVTTTLCSRVTSVSWQLVIQTALSIQDFVTNNPSAKLCTIMYAFCHLFYSFSLELEEYIIDSLVATNLLNVFYAHSSLVDIAMVQYIVALAGYYYL